MLQVGLVDGADESTIFIERNLNPYIAYLSRCTSQSSSLL